MRIVVHAISTAGRVRYANEDRFLIACSRETPTPSSGHASSFRDFSGNGVVAVADGMGGGQAGQFASQRALEVLATCIDGDDSSLPLAARISVGLIEANSALRSASEADPELAGCGSEAALLAVLDSDVCLARIGNATIFIVRNGEVYEPLRQLRWLDFLWCGSPPESFPKSGPEVRSLMFPVSLGGHHGAPASIARARRRAAG